jgi:hypothetical protein
MPVSWDALVNEISPVAAAPVYANAGTAIAGQVLHDTTDSTKYRDVTNPNAPPGVDGKGPDGKDGKGNIPNIDDPAWDAAKWENDEITLTIAKKSDIEKYKAGGTNPDGTPMEVEDDTCMKNCQKTYMDRTEKCKALGARVLFSLAQAGCPYECTYKPAPPPDSCAPKAQTQPAAPVCNTTGATTGGAAASTR